MLSRKLSRIFYGGFWTHVSSSKPMERKTRRARLAAISSIVFTVKRLVKRQYLLVQTTACNYEVRALRVYFRCKEYLLGLHLMTIETFAAQRSRGSLSSFTNTLMSKHSINM